MRISRRKVHAVATVRGPILWLRTHPQISENRLHAEGTAMRSRGSRGRIFCPHGCRNAFRQPMNRSASPDQPIGPGAAATGTSLDCVTNRPTTRRIVLVFSDLYVGKEIPATVNKISRLWLFSLDISTAGVTIRYHLRSVSGSNGPEARESSPLLSAGLILLVVSGDAGGRPVE